MAKSYISAINNVQYVCMSSSLGHKKTCWKHIFGVILVTADNVFGFDLVG